MDTCMGCRKTLSERHQVKYCSNKCQTDYQHERWVKRWKKGLVSGGTGITVRAISSHLKRYLSEKFNTRCSICRWNKKHTITGVVPLEIDHIDGNAENNMEKNLRLLCPNCHALTPFYKNLNKGNGRKWRMDKYIRNENTK